MREMAFRGFIMRLTLSPNVMLAQKYKANIKAKQSYIKNVKSGQKCQPNDLYEKSI